MKELSAISKTQTHNHGVRQFWEGCYCGHRECRAAEKHSRKLYTQESAAVTEAANPPPALSGSALRLSARLMEDRPPAWRSQPSSAQSVFACAQHECCSNGNPKRQKRITTAVCVPCQNECYRCHTSHMSVYTCSGSQRVRKLLPVECPIEWFIYGHLVCDHAKLLFMLMYCSSSSRMMTV